MPSDVITYDKLRTRIENDPKLSIFDTEPNGVVYFYKDDIGHPESILVTRAENGELSFFEISHQYDNKTEVRGKKAVLGAGGKGIVYYGRNIKTGDPVAVKKLSSYRGGPQNSYDIADRLNRSSTKSLIGLYGYGVSEKKPTEKRSPENQNKTETAFYSIMEIGLRTLTKGNLALSTDEKKSIFTEALQFGFLLQENNCTYQDYNSENILLDKQNHFKVCDLEGLVNYDGAQIPALDYAMLALDWIYNELPATQKNIVHGKIKELHKKYKERENDKNLLTDTDFNSDINQIIQETEPQAQAAVKSRPPPPQKKEMFSREYGQKDILIADLSYYAQKNQTSEAIKICAELKKLKLDKETLNKIENSLQSINESGLNELTNHAELFDFQPVANILIKKLSLDKKLETVDKVSGQSAPTPTVFILHIATDYYKAQLGRKNKQELNQAQDNLKQLDKLLDKFNQPVFEALKNEVKMVIAANDIEITNIKIAEQNIAEKKQISYFITQLTTFFNDDTKHPISRKSSAGLIFGSSAVNFTNKETCKYKLAQVEKFSPTDKNNDSYEKITTALNLYLDKLLDNLESPLGNKSQNESRYLTALKEQFGIQGDITRNYFTAYNVKNYTLQIDPNHAKIKNTKHLI